MRFIKAEIVLDHACHKLYYNVREPYESYKTKDFPKLAKDIYSILYQE